MLALLLTACAPPEDGADCRLESTVPTYQPACEATLVLYPDQTRLLVDDRIEVQFGPNPAPGDRYGGATGNWMAAMLDDEVADSRSTITFGDALEEVALDLLFSEGTVQGTTRAAVIQAEER